MAKSKLTPSTTTSSSRPTTISLPPRTSYETLFTSSSPGPMTLLSSFFSPDAASNPPSFSQLLAGAMVSPAQAASLGKVDGKEEEEFKYKQNRPVNLVVSGSEVDSKMFMIPPGLSPSGFLNSPGIFSPALSPFGMSHQQALAQVTAQAAYANTNMHYEAGKSTTSLNNPAESYKAPMTPELKVSSIEPLKDSQSLTGVKSQSIIVDADKPADDGYNWRKYGQKQVKGSQYPRSYYKCTHSHCSVTKKVERSPEGQIIEIIYKGQHNHEHPLPKKPVKGGNALNEIPKSQPNPEVNQLNPTEAASDQIQGNVQESLETSPHSRQIKTEKVASHELKGPSETDNGPNQKRRSLVSTAIEPAHSLNTVMEAKIIVQTRSEVDLLDDGFRWRKYGQKVVKGNYHPRSYYKCTSAGCNVRKHVERAPTDPKAVMTTYEGKHNHEIPVGRGSSLNISSALPNQKLQMVVADI